MTLLLELMFRLCVRHSPPGCQSGKRGRLQPNCEIPPISQLKRGPTPRAPVVTGRGSAYGLARGPRPSSRSRVEQAGAHDELAHPVDTDASFQVREHEWLRAAHLLGIAIH